GRDHQRAARGEEERREEIVGDAVGGLGEEVGRRGRDDDRVGALGERHVLDGVLALRIEEVRQHRPAGERAEGERAHELARVLGEAHGDGGAEPGQLAQEVDGLVRGDRPGDAEDQLAAREAHAFGVSPSSFTRYSTLAAAISSSAPLVGFLWWLSTRGGAPRLSCRARLAARTTSRYRFETLFNALSSEGNAINCVPPDRAG